MPSFIRSARAVSILSFNASLPLRRQSQRRNPCFASEKSARPPARNLHLLGSLGSFRPIRPTIRRQSHRASRQVPDRPRFPCPPEARRVTKLGARLAGSQPEHGAAEASLATALRSLDGLTDAATADMMRAATRNVTAARNVWVMGIGLSAHSERAGRLAASMAANLASQPQ